MAQSAPPIDANNNASVPTSKILSSAWSLFPFKSAKRSPKNDHQNESDLSSDTIKQLVLNELSNHPNLYHEKDVEMVKQDESYIQSMIDSKSKRAKDAKQNIDMNVVYDFIIEDLKWRKEFGINDMNGGMFPQELDDMKIFYVGKCDDGTIMVYIMGNRHRSLSGLTQTLVNSWIFYAEQFGKKFGRNFEGSVLLDLTNCGLKNCDIPALFSNAPMVMNHLSHLGDTAYVIGLPRILQPLAKGLTSLAPSHLSRRIKFTSKQELDQVMAMNRIPTYLGGPVQMMELASFTDGCPKISFKQLHQQLNLSDDVLKRNKKVISEIERDIEAGKA